MSLVKICSVTLFVIVGLPGRCHSWVFTEISYDKLRKELAYDDEDFGNVLTDEELNQRRFSLIYPGTKWCGSGNVADSYEDLGSSWQADMCCREHDNCPDLMEAGETKNDLTNNAFYTRLSCECDETFRKCLRNANSSVASQIGGIYFNALGTECFRNDYPIMGCMRYGGWFNKKCLEYTYDLEGKKRFQWFDVPNF